MCYMNSDIITLNEVTNNGKTIHLYYDMGLGFYVAYGYSAFFVTHIVEAATSYSDDMLMPVALMRRSDLPALLRAADGPSRDYQDYVRFELHRKVPLDGYRSWVEGLKE